jgi:hypothetical protein
MLQLGLEAGERRALVLALARRGFLEDRCRAGPHSDWRRVATSAMAKGRRSVEKMDTRSLEARRCVGSS